ncbi:MAG: acetyl-CoA acetyltransferase [Pseudomonadota bacterium]
MNPPDRTPVLVGIGTATRREQKFEDALEPMDLMLEAVAAAGRDSGSAATLPGAQYIAVPRGRWTYSNPAGEIARKVGAGQATTVLTSVGVLQQTLIGEACARIARGEAHTTLIAGADTGYRLLRAQIAGQKAGEREQGDAPDIFMAPKDELRHAVEKRVGLQMPVGLYAIMESALRARHGWSVAHHRDRLAELGERFSRIAAANPHAWQRNAVDAATIRNASDHNPMQAFPYTRSHCSTWNVDQAGALLFCSAARAEQLGIPRSRWVFPVASTESNHMVAVSAREDLAACHGARIAGQAALDAGGFAAEDIDLVDLYSCFPIAVQAYASALGFPLTRELTVTGGMPFAGGPYNNYMFQATCRAAELLREGKGRTALVSCVSGVLTKQAFGLWSVDPAPQGFVHADLTDAVAREVRELEVLDEFTGEAKIAGYTVLHGRGQQPRGIALVDTPQGQRAMTTTEDPVLIAQMQEEEFVGRRVKIQQNRLMP